MYMKEEGTGPRERERESPRMAWLEVVKNDMMGLRLGSEDALDQ